MRQVTIGTQIVCLTNGLIWQPGMSVDPEPEEADPLYVMWWHWEHTHEWRLIWKAQYEANKDYSDDAVRQELDWNAAQKRYEQERAQNGY